MHKVIHSSALPESHSLGNATMTKSIEWLDKLCSNQYSGAPRHSQNEWPATIATIWTSLIRKCTCHMTLL